ncbi:hypothetical protein [Deinococcus petrolearius]|uniref:Uncharacterized protein n=1 Tax=Deinococcus petrolearius TaxID=1751295 RepID=A0ABW1DL83_9DEIO
MSSSRRSLPFLGAVLAAGLLSACTGIVETSPGARLAVLNAGGTSLGYLNTDAVQGGLQGAVAVEGGVDLATLSGGRALALTRAAGIEQRDVNLENPQAFPGFTAVPCLTQTAQSAARDRLLTLSQCTANGPQTLALYRADRSLVWTTTLSVTPPIPTTDTPPTRLAVRGDTGVVARAALGGGSEVVVVSARSLSDPIQDGTPLVGVPQPTSLSIRDLAPSGDLIYAATDTGVRPLLATGLPDEQNAVAAFGSARVDRLWAGVSGTRTLLAAWRDNALSGNGTEPLRLWDGTRTTAAPTVAYFADLRDVTLDLSGNLYALSATTLTGYDTVLGLNQNTWSGALLLNTLNDARSVTWLVP